MKTKSKLEKLTTAQIEAITRRAAARNDVPLVSSKQISMRLDGEHFARARKLAENVGVPLTTLLTQLIREDIDRMWGAYQGAKR